IKQMKESYEARIRALEDRLKAAEAASATAEIAPSPPPASSASIAASTLAAFNPAIAVVLQGTYADLKQDPDLFAFNNFAIAPDVGPGRRGLGLAESEITFSASVDHLFSGNITIAFTPENTVSVEEAYGVATALPYGLVPKFGRFFSGIGYMNEQHQHAWDFQDAPLAYQAFLGNQFAQDGVQLKWVAPTDTFLEFGGEIGNGDNYPGSPRNSNSAGAGSGFVHAGGDVGTSSSWRAGLSYLYTRAADRAGKLPDTAGNIAETSFAGNTHTTIADFIWKYAPDGNAQQTNFKLQGEYFWQRASGDLTYDSSGTLGLTQTAAYRANQSGWYLQGVWQFLPMWRVGLRYDRLNQGTPDYGANAAFLATDPFSPQRATAMLDWTPSEFSRFRMQYAQSKERPGFTDNQFFLQYILTLGAHGAHKF
ncbi:MAG TPA: TonB-dependent receptor, partial [Casimicrobiaceae bacterium]|nr:TonB-dependent receptor [Casimicrobiaceae bacterium]